MSDPDHPILDPSLSQKEKESLALRLFFELYRKGEFYDCHDILEEIWFDSHGENKIFFQGLLQCAVARLHHERDNLHGAHILYRDGTAKLEAFRPEFLGVDLELFLKELADSLPSSITHRGI
jgi:predicted metal-dependent hydrolase